jgi:beta-lactam-binding protein with PASTA domain
MSVCFTDAKKVADIPGRPRRVPGTETGRDGTEMAYGVSRFKWIATFTLLCMVSLILLSGCGNAPVKVESVAVPDLAGKSEVEARGLLEEAGLMLGDVEEAYADAVASGLIVSSSPDGGEDAEKGTAVDISVSKGPEMVGIPSLLGTAEADAATALQGLGFQVEVKRIYSEEVKAGLVCGMEPAPDSAAARGSRVVVTISDGSAYIACPTCGGDGSITDARTCPDCGGTGFCDT